MVYKVAIDDARAKFPDYEFIDSLTPSAQKAAFHVRDKAGQSLCLKLIAPDYGTDRLQREIQALRQLNHPNVVKLIEYTFSSRAEDDRHFIIEEFVAGHDLTHILNGTPWLLGNAIKFFTALASGLAAMHDAKIIHRDLKPQNIRVRQDGSPVIIDFGVARHLTLPDLTNTIEGAGIGTPLYFSPEQFDGTKRDIDCRTDLFAAGVIMHQALTGRHPFLPGNNPTRQALKDAVCGGAEGLPTTSLNQLPAKWQLLLRKLLARERINRPVNSQQVIKLLERMPSDKQEDER